MRGNGAFPEDHLTGIDVVVDRVEGRTGGKTGLFNENLGHLFAAPSGKSLTDLNVVEVVIKGLAIQITEVFGHVWLGLEGLPFKLFQSLLDLALSALFLVSADELVSFGDVIGIAGPVEIDRELLVEFGYLFAEVPRT